MRDVDVLVVGAGPAGVAAALEAHQAGASTLLLDEFGVAGGSLRWSVARQSGMPDIFADGRGFELAARCATALGNAGIELVAGVAWGLFEDGLVGVVANNRSWQVHAGAIILATGSTDIVEPFPGWDLPGVLTARAAMRALHEWRVLPGERVALLGAGAAAAEVREAFELAGVQTVLTGTTIHVGGTDRVAWADIDGQRAEVDCVVIALGRQPDPELALQALCEIGFSELDRAFVPLRSQLLETSVSGLYVVGDAAGCCSTAEALAEGRLAGRAAVAADTTAAVAALEALRPATRAAEIAHLCWPAPADA